MHTISTEALTKDYGRRIGIDGLNLDIDGGAIFGFLGPNGAGKSTTIRLLLGLLKPTSGRASIFGMDAWRESHRIKADVGYISGDFRSYTWMDLNTALKFVGGARGRDLTSAGLELAERFALPPEVPARQMSRGMRQKLGLILAFVHQPRLLVLDEPTTALDPPMQQAVYDYLREAAASGTTVFFSSHTLSEVEELCERVAILRDAKLVTNESLESLRERAERMVTLTWRNGPADIPDPPPFLKLENQRDRTWTCSLQGNVPDLIQWSAVRPIEDMTISPPDLEHLFRSFYDA